MEILDIFALRGPNIWSRRPVLEAWVDLQDLKETASDSVPGFVDRLIAWLPGLIEHRCSVGERGGFLQRLRDGTYPAHILEHVTLELQTCAGTPVGFGKARETSRPGVYKVVVRYKDEQVARACLLTARELLLAAYRGEEFPVEAEIKRLRLFADDVCLGPSTTSIVTAAEARGIPAQRLNAGSLVQLGYGARQRRIWTAETDRTSAIAESIAQDKELTKSLLRAAGVPVPEGRAVRDPADAWAAACEIGLPVVVKPRDGNHGRGVFTKLVNQVQVETAFTKARAEGSGVLVERFAPGNEHRLLVVGDRLVAAARGEAAYIVADGVNTVRRLVDLQLNSDPRRGEDDSCPLALIEFDSSTRLELERQGYDPDSVPPASARVLIQRNGNVAFDVTDLVHPSVAANVVLAAAVVGLDIAGIDVVAEDISRPLEEQGGVIVEVNASPGLHPHLKPAAGTPRPVGEAILETLFPPGENGRIPIVSVTGTNGKTTVARLVAHLLKQAGRTVGVACTDGVFVDGRVIDRGDCSGPRSARKVLLNPRVDAAVLESGRGGILREGLGFDRCDVAVVTNIGEADHLGHFSIETPEQMYTVKRCGVDVVLPSGAAVLKGDDPLVARMLPLCAGAVILFARDGAHPELEAHRAAGKRVVFLRDGWITLAEGEVETPVADVAAIPFTRGGRVGFQVENALASAAVAWWVGMAAEAIASGLQSFGAAAELLPGRFNLFESGEVTAVVDDAHNVSALTALIEALGAFPAARRTAVYSAGAGRRDEDIAKQGALLADAFQRVVVYEDRGAEERAPGELVDLLRSAIEGASSAVEVVAVPAHAEAVNFALNRAVPGELVMIQTEDSEVAPSVSLAQAWASGRRTSSSITSGGRS